MNEKKIMTRAFTYILYFIFGVFLADVAHGQTTGKLLEKPLGKSLEKSLLWEISGKELTKPSYLFGTIHLACNTEDLLSDGVKSALEVTERVVLEIDMDDPNMLQTVQKFSMNEGMQNFSASMNEEDKALVDEFYQERFKAGLAQLGIMKPFVLMSMIYPSYLDCTEQTAVDMLLVQAATANEKEVLGLESVEDQMGMFDKIPMEEQIEMLVMSIKDFDKYKADFEELSATYLAEDIVSLYESFQKYPEYAKYEDMFLADRNKSWIEKIEKLISEKPSFIGVGAAHLAAENGVINLLREVGYTVTPVLDSEN